MKCKKCDGVLKFRFPGKRENKNNLGFRSGCVILKLICSNCGEKYLCNDDKFSHPYQTHPHRKEAADIKKVRVVRLSDKDMEDIKSGKKRLTIRGKSITLAV